IIQLLKIIADLLRFSMSLFCLLNQEYIGSRTTNLHSCFLARLNEFALLCQQVSGLGHLILAGIVQLYILYFFYSFLLFIHITYFLLGAAGGLCTIIHRQ